MKPLSFKTQSGLSLTETMVALAISLILLAGVMQILMSNKQSHRVQEAFARLQENGRFAMQFITRDLRMAGYMGCASLDTEPGNIVDLNQDGAADLIASFSGNGLQGKEYADLPLALSDTVSLTTTNVVAGTDIVLIKHASRTGVRLDDPVPTISGQLKLDATTASGMFQPGDILFVTDCEQADVFAATSTNAVGAAYVEIAHASTLNLSPPHLSKAYTTEAEVMKMQASAYYIANNSAGVPSLFKYSLGNADTLNSQELVEGIEDLQVLYGVDSDGDRVVNRFVDASGVSNFSQVISARVTLRARTIEDNITTNVTAFGDHRVRRSFTTLVTIRNRTS
ncbi:MAG: PilW family protein [Gammaproteobacteria bacterium]|nr:PilW family protein [Gammaproteobacteria bacterium]MDH5803091.1 PilW family protein [Gammaproteobacteria bacterium]